MRGRTLDTNGRRSWATQDAQSCEPPPDKPEGPPRSIHYKHPLTACQHSCQRSCAKSSGIEALGAGSGERTAVGSGVPRHVLQQRSVASTSSLSSSGGRRETVTAGSRPGCSATRRDGERAMGCRCLMRWCPPPLLPAPEGKAGASGLGFVYIPNGGHEVVAAGRRREAHGAVADAQPARPVLGSCLRLSIFLMMASWAAVFSEWSDSSRTISQTAASSAPMSAAFTPSASPARISTPR